MTLEAKDKLISDLIKENPDSAIRDYLVLLQELESIEHTPRYSLPVQVQTRDTSGRFSVKVWMPAV